MYAILPQKSAKYNYGSKFVPSVVDSISAVNVIMAIAHAIFDFRHRTISISNQSTYASANYQAIPNTLSISVCMYVHEVRLNIIQFWSLTIRRSLCNSETLIDVFTDSKVVKCSVG